MCLLFYVLKVCVYLCSLLMIIGVNVVKVFLMIFLRCRIVFFLFSLRWNFFLILSMVLFGLKWMFGILVLIMRLKRLRIRFEDLCSVVYVRK